MADVPSWAQAPASADIPSWAGSSAAPTGPNAVPNWAQTPATQQSSGGIFGDRVSSQSLGDLVTGQHKPSWANAPMGMVGSFFQAVDNGLLTSHAAQWAAETFDVGHAQDRLRAKYPGQTDAWYKQQAHNMYNGAMLDLRRQDEQLASDNPYPGHIVGNTVAGAVGSLAGDPELALIPGAPLEAGVLKQGIRAAAPKVARYVGSNAVRMGAGNLAADTASQILDNVQGLQMGWDVDRSLKSAGMGAVLGAGGAAIHATGASPIVQNAPIPDFVKNLFLSRGVDTTPQDTPQGRTSALTGERMQFSPEEQQQLKQLLRTGSVDDIKQFFQGKNGPQPTWAQVNQLVEMRDGGRDAMPLPDRTRTNQDQRARFAQAMDESIAENHRQLVSDHIGALTKDWKNSPDVEVINHVNDIQDPQVRQSAIDDGVSHENTVGFVGDDGKVRVFAPQVKTPEAVNAVLYHEALGHFGLAQQFGAGLDKVLQTLDARNVGQFKAAVDKWMADNPGAYGGSRVRAAEEVLAEASQNGPLKKSWGDAVVSTLRNFGRRMGLNLSYSDNEVNHILAMAHDAVINGKSSAAANRFSMGGRDLQGDHTKWANFSGGDTGDSGNRMMYVGQNAENVGKPGLLSKKGWFTGPDGKLRFEISDHDAELSPKWDTLPAGNSVDLKGENQSYKLGDILDHPNLYKAYPELKDLKVTKNPAFMDVWGSTQGWFDPKKGVLNVAPRAQDPKSTMLHEIQHWIQTKEGFSFGGNSDTVRLDDKDALSKLKSFYERKLTEAHEDEQRYARDGYVDPFAAKSRTPVMPLSKVIMGRLDRVHDLMDDDHELRSSYSAAEQLKRAQQVVQLQAKRIVEKYENAHNEAIRQYNEKKDKFHLKYDDLSKEWQQAFDAKDYKRAGELTKQKGELSDAYYKGDNKYPSMDWNARRKEMDANAQRGIELQIKIDDVLRNIEGLKGKYSDLSHDLYRLIAGEREARDVQARMYLEPGERKQIAPYTHEGILNSEVIHTTAADVGAAHDAAMSGEEHGRQADETIRNLRWGETPQDRLIRAQRVLSIHGGEHPEARQVADEAAHQLGYPSPEHATLPQEHDENLGDHFFDNRPTNQPEYRGERLPTGNDQLDKIRAIREQVAQGEASGNRFMTPKQLNESIANGTYETQQMERAYNATDRDYTPTTRSWSDVRQDALRAGFSPSQVKKQGDLPDLQKRVFQTQAAAKVLDSRISDILSRWDTPDLTEGDKDNLRQALVDHAYILTKLRNERADMARALNISKLGYTRAQMESFGEILRESGSTLSPLGDDDTLNRFARQLKALSATGNTAGINSLVSSITKPHWEDYVGTLHHAMMLSGLSTHVKAPLDMMIGIGRDMMDSTGALAFSAGREALRAIGVPVKEGIHPAEVTARMWGILRALVDAGTYVNTGRVFVNGGVNPQGFGGTGRARIPVVSSVMDLISAQDAFFRAFATNMHLYGLATRDAVNNARLANGKMDFDTLLTHGVNMAQSPTRELLQEAREAADQTLLLNRNAMTSPLDAIKRRGAAPDASAFDRAAAFVTNFITPFVRVEANSLWNRVVRRSPLAILDKQTLADLKAGGAAADTAMARVVMGTASIAAGMTGLNTAYNKLTGKGSDNYQKNRIQEAVGWRPDAVHENGQYNTGNKLGVSFNPFDVHNQTATMIHDMVEAYKKGANQGQAAKGIELASYSLFRSMADMSYLHDIAPSINALFAPEQQMPDKMRQLIADQVSTMEPNLFGQAARIGDQGQPMTTVSGDLGGTVLNTLKANIPGQRETLPKRIDPMGGEVQSGASLFGQHTWFPQNNRSTAGNHVNESDDPAKLEIARIDAAFPDEPGVISPTQRKIGKDVDTGKDIKLSNKEYSDYQRQVGQEIMTRMREAMASPDWRQMTDREKYDYIKDMQKEARKDVKESRYGGQ